LYDICVRDSSMRLSLKLVKIDKVKHNEDL